MNNMKGEIRLMNNNTVSSNNPALVNNIDHLWHQQSFFDIHRDTYDAPSCKHSKKLKSEWIENSTRAKSSNHTDNANFIPVGVKSDVFDRVNCPDTNNELTNSSFHVGRCINFPTNDKTIVSNKDGYTSPYSDDSNTSSNSMRSLELLHWIYHQVNITNDHALKKNDEHVDSHPCSAYSEFKEMEQKFHKNCFSDNTNDGAKPNNLLYNKACYKQNEIFIDKDDKKCYEKSCVALVWKVSGK
ncbi:hypothetical protein HELRODRAFT_160575 [Helobdella robusta]|uniref:Uncharacterized protein n=1 Tax=Helobdella robusta TaxID=6412 RepID=T1EQF7_HELRO|nr:hypothetical protein HELRODRAFT_160575 [Helobdella robusta]ESO06404.1 hypothetical protein HELRODRAFT_160575 [Helobdella robusta]